MKVKAHHPIVEAMAKKLFGIEMCPPEEQKCMVARAVSVVAEMAAELEADAKLGRMVRGMPKDRSLLRGEEDWYVVENVAWDDEVRGMGSTPEEALENAGVLG